MHYLKLLGVSIAITLTAIRTQAQKDTTSFCVSIKFLSEAEINYTHATPKYIRHQHAKEYSTSFQQGFLSYLRKNNVCIIPFHDTIGIDTFSYYLIEVSELLVKESIEAEVHTDDEGIEYKVRYYSCGASSGFTIEKFHRPENKKKFTEFASDAEHIHQNRTFFEVMLGLNKGNNPHKVKDLPSDIFIRLSKNAGEASAKSSVREIRKLIRRSRKR